MSKITIIKEKEIIYAKTLNPEDFDYRVYDIREDEGNELYVLGGRDYCDIDNKDYLKSIQKLINDYNSYFYESYYDNFREYVNDMLPHKENGKNYSPVELHNLKVALDENEKNKIICLCLSIITGKKYIHSGLRGCCQGDYVDAFYPEEEDNEYVDFVEAWYFGTGVEIEIHDCKNIPQTAEDIEGYTFYTATWGIDNLKREIKRQCGYKEDDDNVEVKLWLYKNSHRIRKDNY